MGLLKNIPLESVLPNPKFALRSVSTRYRYKDNERTDEIDGIVYSVIDLVSLNPLSVVVNQRKPVISEEQIAEAAKDNAHIFVRFINAVVTPYLSRNKTLEESVKADGAALVDEENGEEILDI